MASRCRRSPVSPARTGPSSVADEQYVDPRQSQGYAVNVVQPGSPMDKYLSSIPTLDSAPTGPAPKDTFTQWSEAMAARHADPGNLDLRDREHALFTQHLMDTYGPVLGRAIALSAVPAWTGAKAIAQSLPTPVSQAIDRQLPQDFQLAGPQTSPASMREVKAGLAPVFQNDYTPQAYDSLLKFLGVR